MSQLLQNEGAQQKCPAHRFQSATRHSRAYVRGVRHRLACVALANGDVARHCGGGLWWGFMVSDDFGGTAQSSLATHVLTKVTAICVKGDTAVLSICLGAPGNASSTECCIISCCTACVVREYCVGAALPRWLLTHVVTHGTRPQSRQARVCAALLLKLACRRIYSLQNNTTVRLHTLESGTPAQSSLL